MALSALAINCTLKASPQQSSCDLLLTQAQRELEKLGVTCEQLRAVDFDIKPGVTSDEGPGDDWPMIRQKVLAADILLLGTPIWLGHPSSVCQRILERLDAFLGETDDQQRMVSYGRVACVAVVGNEDGAHHVVAELYQGLNDVGFTIPANGCTYWVGEAMGSTDYKDAGPREKTANTNAMLARNAVHLAKLLKQSGYPGASE
ncbi:flavodoxin family protein [Stutzerimonas nitrititolerans]|uniref:Flavodoxin family protein n=1 Tax=Stutzerimonas nitrititolerans TaxID=2482751 RepID=A0ABX9UZD3_9GAMM|nr:NAD(P)H-dependent oxidoreductase [Stutzerimonas nitrititolerans]KRW73546.1 flavodoxin [Pseudomonas sp. TTU2014-096BSC]RRV23335.1 flavodoxin family protein [Pseudomonas sp. s199]WAD26205.1 NAD(P)H-dependent oxidoreductase [Pseudomonadaceae bacterium T75]HAQ24706.1 flavodoxin family protein [Pseudomonas sp.]RMH98821.1 flavodoxin family protein [Stutzerimonas nitrititolerans]